MRVNVIQDEWWPMYSIDENDWPIDVEVEITLDELRWIKEINKEFARTQDFLEKKYDKAKEKRG